MPGNKHSPLLSVTLAAHNVAPWVGLTLDGVRGQSFGDWECVAVDDGSGDGTGALLDDRVRADIRFRVVHQPQRGLSAARNRGVAHTKGAWVGFLDGDDAVAPWWLASVARAASKPGLSLIRHGFCVWRGGAVPVRVPLDERRVIEGAAAIHAWGWRTFATEGFTWRLFVRREIARGVPFQPGLPSQEDSIYGFDLLPCLHSVCECAACAHFYRRRRGSILHSSYSVEAPLQLLRHVRRQLAAPLPEAAARARHAALAWFALHAVTDWALRPRREERERFSEVRAAFARLLADGVFTLRQLVPMAWAPGIWPFLRWGWLWPLRMWCYGACVCIKLRRLFGRRA